MKFATAALVILLFPLWGPLLALYFLYEVVKEVLR